MSCDKTSTSKKNYIQYNNKQYDLSQGIMLPGDSLDKSTEVGTIGHSINLLLMSSGFTIHESNGMVDSISGKGTAIVFEVYSNSSDKIDDGQYVFDSLSFAQPGTFDYADAVFDYDILTEEGTEVEMNAGTLTVKKSGNDYEFTFDCKAYDGKTVTGYYKGVVKSDIGNLSEKSIENRAKKAFGWDFIHEHR